LNIDSCTDPRSCYVLKTAQVFTSKKTGKYEAKYTKPSDNDATEAKRLEKDEESRSGSETEERIREIVERFRALR
jgi:hypothetical protein